jgi:hypothetical protein
LVIGGNTTTNGSGRKGHSGTAAGTEHEQENGKEG